MTNGRVKLPPLLSSPSEKECPPTDIIHIYSTITLYVEPKFEKSQSAVRQGRILSMSVINQDLS